MVSKNEKKSKKCRDIPSREQKQNYMYIQKKRIKKIKKIKKKNYNVIQLIHQGKNNNQKNKSQSPDLIFKNETQISQQGHIARIQDIPQFETVQESSNFLIQNDYQMPNRNNQQISSNNSHYSIKRCGQNNDQYLNKNRYDNWDSKNQSLKRLERKVDLNMLIQDNEEMDNESIIINQQKSEIEKALKNVFESENPNQFYKNKKSVLIDCVKNNFLNEVELLLENKFDPNIQDFQGFTALHHACQNNQLDMVKLLLDYFAKIDIQDLLGKTPLHIACQKNRLEIVKLLLDQNINLNQIDKEGYTPLMYVCCGGRKYKQKLFDQQIRQTYPFQNIIQLVQTDFKEENKFYQIAQLLIRNGADINQVDNQGNSSLMIACYFRIYPIAQLLIEKKAILDTFNNQKETAFMISCIKKDQRLQRLLIESGANLEIHNNEGLTGYLYLCKVGKTNDVQFLLDQNINIYQTSLDQKLGCQIAQENNNKETSLVIKNHYHKLLQQQRQMVWF